MRTKILSSVVSGLIALSLAACSAANREPVDQSAQAETPRLTAPPASASAAAPTADTAGPEPRHSMRHAPDPAALVQRFDKNGDGALQLSELPEHMQKWLAKADTNADGVLSVDELKAGGERFRAERTARLDANHDGTVSPEERKAAFEKFAQERFARMDKNGDGALTKDEVGDRHWAHLSVADLDKNGSVTQAEIQQAIASGALKLPHRGWSRGMQDGEAAPALAPAAPSAPNGS